MQFVKKTYSLKWFVFLCMLSFRGMRPQEALAVNILDFSEDYTKLTYREAKTNKLRVKEHLIPDLAKLIRAYVALNKDTFIDGYLFPFYKKKVNGVPFTTSHTAQSWFIREVRDKLKKEHPAFDEWWPVTTTSGNIQKRYRIALYSFRRFFETYIYIHNEFAPMSTALIKELMEYNSRFDPLCHYIKIVHQEEQKAMILDKTLLPLSQFITEGQKSLVDYCQIKV